jgi:hypothetical protein
VEASKIRGTISLDYFHAAKGSSKRCNFLVSDENDGGDIEEAHAHRVARIIRANPNIVGVTPLKPRPRT